MKKEVKASNMNRWGEETEEEAALGQGPDLIE